MPASNTGFADDWLDEVHCAQVIADQLSAWVTKSEFLPSSDSTDEIRLLRSPTEELGTWVVVIIESGKVGRLLRVSADTEMEVRLDEDCNMATNQRRRELPDDGLPLLTDADVARIVRENRRGVFYAWSPHMPLSVEGYAEIAVAAKSLAMAVTPVLSSHANIDYAMDRARRVGLPEQGLALNRSIELTMRDLNVHAPAILIYANGAFASPVIPGFRRAADYESLILRFLAE